MSDILYFLREKRAGILIGGGFILALFWLLLMINYNLFTILPFGSGLSMGLTLLIAICLSPVLLFGTYWGGSEDSPIAGTFVHNIARVIYISFKNSMIFLAIFTLVIGMPRLKYYQMRDSGTSGLSELSYYQQRTLFNLFRDGSYIVESSMEHSENVSPDYGIVPPVGGVDVDSDSSSSSSSKSSDNDWIGDLLAALAQLLVFLLVFLAIVYFIGLAVLCFFFADFWLVALICIAIGMICLGFIDIHDGPEV